MAAATCPGCGAASVEAWTPFCSKRCADVDLGRWMTGQYTVPRALTEDDDVRPDVEVHDG